MIEETDEAPIDPAFADAIRRWLRDNTQRGIMYSWLAETSKEVVGAVSVRIRETSPREYDFAGREAYVHNLYVDPALRQRGIGRALMQALLDWCKANGYSRIALRATEMARPLYEKLGFVADRQMAYRGKD